MDRIHDLEAFIETVEQGSLTAAARKLGRSLQSISRSLMTLEQSLGVELVQRTTRKSRTTEAGQDFFERVQPAVAELLEARDAATSLRASPKGCLRISAPTLFGPAFVMPILSKFMELFPEVDAELQLSDRFESFADGEIDLAIRIGELPDSDLKAIRLGALRRVFFSSPQYLARHGVPRHPGELADYACVTRIVDGRTAGWPYLSSGKVREIKIAGRLRSNNSTALYAAVLAGAGISYTPLWQIRDMVDAGRLEVILADYETTPAPLHAVWPNTRRPPAKTRAFLDMLVEEVPRLRLE